MQIVSTVEEVRKQVKKWREEGLSVGLVPTMGYLHEGHKSLIDKAVEQNDRVVVSVFACIFVGNQATIEDGEHYFEVLAPDTNIMCASDDLWFLYKRI